RTIARVCFALALLSPLVIRTAVGLTVGLGFGIWALVEQFGGNGRRQRPRPAFPEPAAPRLSRAAVVGLLWAPMFFVAFVLMFTARRVEGPYQGPSWAQVAMAATLLPLGVAAPFA